MSQIRCGTLRQNKDPKAACAFEGQVVLGSRLQGQIFLTRITREGAGENAPEYDVQYKHNGGPTRLVGAAWLKNHPNVGDFLSLTLDDPDWPSPLNLSVFPPGKGQTEWQIVWSRPRGGRVQDEG